MNDLACHACGKVHPDVKPIALPDGRTVGNYSSAYKTYCEARWVYFKAKNRHSYLEDIQRIRGKAAYETLRLAMLEIHFEKKK